jgi:predicted MFS family arabinose efflux permease
VQSNNGEDSSAAQLHPLLLPALCAASAISVLNALALSPFLAEMSDDLGISVALLGQSLTVSGLLGAGIGLFVGPAAERIGYRRVLLAGTVALLLSNVGTALAPSFELLLLTQLANGISGATISPMAFAFAGALYDAEMRRHAISRIYAVAAGVEVVGLPALAALGDVTSWRWSFAAMGSFSIVLYVLAAVALPRLTGNPQTQINLRAIARAYAPIVRFKPVALLYVAQFLRGICWTGMLAYVGAFIDDELGYSLRAAGLVWTVLGAGFLAGSLLVGGRLRLLDARRTFIVTTALLGAFIGLTFWWQAGIALTFALLFIVSTAGGAAEVTAATVISAETPAPQGPTMSLHSSTLRFGTATGALVGGALLAIGGYGVMSAGLPLFAVAAIAATWFSGRPVRATVSLVRSPSD